MLKYTFKSVPLRGIPIIPPAKVIDWQTSQRLCHTPNNIQDYYTALFVPPEYMQEVAARLLMTGLIEFQREQGFDSEGNSFGVWMLKDIGGYRRNAASRVVVSYGYKRHSQDTYLKVLTNTLEELERLIERETNNE